MDQFSEEVQRFLNEKNSLKRYRMLYKPDSTGLADIFASDYQTACFVLAGCPMVSIKDISTLHSSLPGGNKKLKDDEIALVEGILSNTRLGFDPDYILTHRAKAYKHCMQVITAAIRSVERDSGKRV